MDRAQFYRENPNAVAWAELARATELQNAEAHCPSQLAAGQERGRRAIVLGSGVAGLTTAYELLAQDSGMEVTVLEALGRTGGRCLTLRTGDTLTEDVDAGGTEEQRLFEAKPGATQVVRFQRPTGDQEPYLNAGPGRIPSSHKRLLSYLRQFGVEVEVYVMNSESNLVQMEEGPLGDEPLAYRRLDHNTRGWIAEMVFGRARELLTGSGVPDEDLEERTKQLQSLMISFGELIPTGMGIGRYFPEAGENGLENAMSRAGFEVLPGVEAGKTAKAIGLEALLESEFWRKTRFYQPADFLWQPTLFQPVGGMDQVQHAFAQQVSALGGTIHLNSPVQSIDWDADQGEFVVRAGRVGTEDCVEYRADYCFSNIAMPFLKRLLSEELQDPEKPSQGLAKDFKAGLQAVYAAQFPQATDCGEGAYTARFLANTTKVGWQAERELWQGTTLAAEPSSSPGARRMGVPHSEVGVVPIFGGISWTDHEILQIWYPSTGYHDHLGILTGAYNFGATAFRWGRRSVQERLDLARDGAQRFGQAFGDGLKQGVAIAWQNMPHIKGGWAQWHTVEKPEDHFNVLTQGSGIYGPDGELSAPKFFIVGDQVSSLPGWQEGAIASALNAVGRLANPGIAIPHLAKLPDTRLMVEGI